MMKDTSLTQMSSETCECYSFRNVLFSWWHDGECIVALYELTDRHIRCYPTKRSNTGSTYVADCFIHGGHSHRANRVIYVAK